ncbi:hypothetical protein BT96DRAFT_1067627 [Gymnopus androsaceus JB14]|uniref:Membrane anchor Opy2 N-terminal domain-containing protein n=1 Tax=Gymnopus androsaceus JB14 TaxID=1447944 RepID=A0A6A4IP88_9AGAR|nr:hypothetical protein BT96DRAFT_1067627 [Gymnopus androsaceus JB14]
MHLDALLSRDNCDNSACTQPVCTCDTTISTCVLVSQTCNQCSFYECQAKQSSSSSSSGGISAGAVAGAVVGSLVFFAIVLGLFLWYRRRFRSTNPDVAELTFLNRPDPMEKHHSVPTPPTEMNTVRVYSSSSNTTIDLDPESQSTSHHTAVTTQRTSVRSNPFDDNHSIQTTGTEGTNVIPIALSLSALSEADTSRSNSPMRPSRSPELNLNLEHVNVSHDSIKASGKGNYPTSTISGISGISRNSYLSSASYSSDFLNEAPMIITPSKGAVRQVLGVVKAEMINAPTAEGLKPGVNSKPPIRSPLAASSFGPADITGSDTASVSLSEEGGNPFSDKNSTRTTLASSPTPSRTTFGEPSPALAAHTDWDPSGPRVPWARSDDSSRPSSVSTQAGSVIDIANATRVNLGLTQLTESGAVTPRTPFRNTMARLVSPPTPGELNTFEQQQQRALAHAQARAQAQGGHGRRPSASSAMSGTSTRADSILESFPFVPPSPISNRPARSPPMSPLGQQNFNVSPPTPGSQTFADSDSDPNRLDTDLPAPPNRRTLGLSTGSQLSTASTGLGSFPFQIDTGRDSTAPSSYSGRQRASLDTLAITSDLSSFPLGFDRDSVAVPTPRRN